MSETPDAAPQDESPVGEDAFETARLAEEAEGGEEQVAAPEEGEEPAKAVDWEKKAHDKEGLAAKERARRRAAEARERVLEERLARVESKVAAPPQGDDLLSMIQAIPEGDDDPIGKMEAMERVIRAFGKQQAGDAEAEQQAGATRQQISKLATAMIESETDFEADHSDYKEAMEHFKAARQSDFEDMGYTGAALAQVLGNDLLGLVNRCIQGGRDPAEAVYNLARKRGFASGKQQQTDKLKEIAAAARAGTAPSGGKNGGGALTPDAINKLKGAAYDAAWNKYREEQRRAG